VSDEKQGALTREVVGDEVHVIADARLPFEDKTFDAIVVINFLETTRADEKFIEECHRVLKREGRLVVNAGNLKTWTIIQPLRRLLGVSYDRRGLARAGYSEPEMFRILKHGFDVSNMRTYRRFCVTLVDTIMAAAVGPCETVADLDKAVQRYSFAVPFYRLAFQIDMLLFVARGFSLICAAKRRAWLPRKTPVLSDGRSISEAVLSRAFE
jgi:SAM-dependent methyltransferase